ETRKNVCYRYYTNDKIKEIVTLLNEYGIHAYVDHIFGLPDDTPDDYIKAAKFYNMIRPTWINQFWLTYFPKTEIN
ncbi:unnamed protein product, partial [marine sediment metagenome]